MNDFLVECCANSVRSAITGQIAGANRIELCHNLEVGGVTPSKEEIIKGITYLIDYNNNVYNKEGTMIIGKKKKDNLIKL